MDFLFEGKTDWREVSDNPVLSTIKIGNGGYYEYCVGSSCKT